MYNLMSAAAAAGVNRSTVLRAIKAGRISGQRDAAGGWEIDPAEFHRVFPPLPTAPAASAQQDQQQIDAQVALLRNVIEELRRDKEELRRGLEDLRQDRDRWHAAFEAAQRQLPAPAQPDARVGNAAGNPISTAESDRAVKRTAPDRTRAGAAGEGAGSRVREERNLNFALATSDRFFGVP